MARCPFAEAVIRKCLDPLVKTSFCSVFQCITPGSLQPREWGRAQGLPYQNRTKIRERCVRTFLQGQKQLRAFDFNGPKGPKRQPVDGSWGPLGSSPTVLDSGRLKRRWLVVNPSRGTTDRPCNGQPGPGAFLGGKKKMWGRRSGT